MIFIKGQLAVNKRSLLKTVSESLLPIVEVESAEYSRELERVEQPGSKHFNY